MRRAAARAAQSTQAGGFGTASARVRRGARRSMQPAPVDRTGLWYARMSWSARRRSIQMVEREINTSKLRNRHGSTLRNTLNAAAPLLGSRRAAQRRPGPKVMPAGVVPSTQRRSSDHDAQAIGGSSIGRRRGAREHRLDARYADKRVQMCALRRREDSGGGNLEPWCATYGSVIGR